MKIVFFTFYYPPDLSAGSFRSVSLAQQLSNKLRMGDELHIITTHPNRYASHKVKAKDIELFGKIIIHRIPLPNHQGGIITQVKAFCVYFILAYRLTKKLNPDFLIGTSSRLMTGILTGYSGYRLRCKFFIDIRDIFSETISDLFSRKSKNLGVLFKFFFSFLEKKLYSSASGVSVVSKGFPEYFAKNDIDTSRWTFFPNGVDKEFQKIEIKKSSRINSRKTILYVGNIGSGQALETILPDVAKKLQNNYDFIVIGDGAMINILRTEIKKNDIDNIRIIPPVSRIELINYYQESDLLFLHLNDIPAFQRVLPSKIFEYAVFGKPIIAGTKGYSANFIKENIPHASIFDPGNVYQCLECIEMAKSTTIDKKKIELFIKKYAREKIMNDMTSHILNIV
jgi:glycosyltransferase involved in cell wall biosynthesis